MRKLLLVAGFILCISITYAQNHVVVLRTTSGQKVAYGFEESPKLIHKNDIVILKTNKVEVEYKTKEIAKVYVDAVSTKVEEFHFNKGTGCFVDDGFMLSGFKPHEKVQIYTLRGNLVKSYLISSDGRLLIYFSSLPIGSYIIKTNYQSFKIRVK